MKNNRLLVDAKSVYDFAKQSGFYPEFSRGMADLKTLKTLLHEESCTVDAEEVVHGRWEKYQRFVICSNCDTGWPYYKNDTDRFRYCPNCGAKMDGDGNG